MQCPTCGSDEFDALSEQAHTIVDNILKNLQERGGFDATFRECGHDTISEMWDELFDLTLKELLKFKMDMQG